MAVEYDEQYRSLANVEDDADAGLSVPFLRVAELDYNNSMGRVSNYPLIMGAHVGDLYSKTGLISILGSTDTNVIGYLGRHWLPPRFSHLSYQICSRVTAGTPPTDTTTWNLIVSTNLYAGPRILRTWRLRNYNTESFESSSTSWAQARGTIEVPARSDEGYVYLLLAAANSTAAAESAIASYTVQPVIV